MTDRTLSTTAYRAYWLGRYLERAGNTARLVSVNANLFIDLPMRMPLGWLPLVEILSAEADFEALYNVNPGKDKSVRAKDSYEKEVNRFLLSDTRHDGSLMSALGWAKENARALRGALPRETFEHVNEAYLYAKEAFTEPLSRTRRNNGLQHTLERLQQIDGYLSSTMLHQAGWHFIRLGNFMERADMTTRLIDLPTSNLVGYSGDLAPYRDIQWRSVLRSVNAMQAYTVSVQQPVAQPDVLEFLLRYADLPRSYIRCLNTMRNCLKSLPNSKEPIAQVESMRRQIQRARVRTLDGDKLRRFVDARQKQLNTLHNKITNRYFPNQ